ncbi:MAG: hypothetical protein JWL99_6698, partial [Streptomyces oryziradicis]|nr:hypothetical protein [Actinacidiphila oryziradicis]
VAGLAGAADPVVRLADEAPPAPPRKGERRRFRGSS